MHRQSKDEPRAGDTGPVRSGAAWHDSRSWFTRFSNGVAIHAGRPATFAGAVTAVALWGVSGFWFDFGEIWQLAINTSTTIVTFLMVFLIQGTQNRSEQAVQAKLDELIVATQSASNELLGLEEKDEQELLSIHEHYKSLAERSRAVLHDRRAGDNAAR